jgi:hypothetical protein
MDDSPVEPAKRERQGEFGPFAAIVIVVILLVLSGIYFFITREIKAHQTPPPGQGQVNS